MTGAPRGTLIGRRMDSAKPLRRQTDIYVTFLQLMPTAHHSSDHCGIPGGQNGRPVRTSCRMLLYNLMPSVISLCWCSLSKSNRPLRCKRPKRLLTTVKALSSSLHPGCGYAQVAPCSGGNCSCNTARDRCVTHRVLLVAS